MKAKLIFNLEEPEDKRRYMIHVYAEQLHSNYLNLDNEMRDITKYANCDISKRIAQKIRDQIRFEIEGLWGL